MRKRSPMVVDVERSSTSPHGILHHLEAMRRPPVEREHPAYGPCKKFLNYLRDTLLGGHSRQCPANNQHRRELPRKAEENSRQETSTSSAADIDLPQLYANVKRDFGKNGIEKERAQDA
ncbi:unnamed protein product [Cylicocyclus nassatus]|uniref:Uncharacterized protein n=1 Tax=Cylicocyclus nassatus TaxID=53992 RepID=A0AA36DT74_CYLNA|nr:unnamed protein product [Cylicocyclus nassatus]